MIKQSQSSGLFIHKEDEVVTYIVHHEDSHMQPMKYIVNETTGWYVAGTNFQIEGDSLELRYHFFLNHRDFYLNNNKSTAPRIYHVSEKMIYNEAKKIRSFAPYLETLTDTHGDTVLAEAERVISLHFTIGTPQNDAITSEDKRVRMRAKSLVKALRQLIAEFE